jgi:hypothetical protein
MAGKLWIVNYLEPFPLQKRVDRILSDARPPGSNRLVTALVEASDPQVGRLRQQGEVVSLRPVSEPLESTRCVAVNADGVRCGQPASVLDSLWGGMVCEEHASAAERMRHAHAARLMLDTVEGLQQQMNELLDGASKARAQSDEVSVLATELLLGLHSHLVSGKEVLEMAKSSLLNGLKEPE